MSLVSSTQTELRSCLCSATTKLAATCPQDTFPDYEFESDIVDQCIEEQEFPQRPLSRLGFHSAPLDHYVADMEDPSETILPEMMNRLSNADTDQPGFVSLASRFSLMTYDMDEDITAVASMHSLRQDAPQSLAPPLNALRINTAVQCDNINPFLSPDDDSDFSDSESSSDCSCDNSDEDFDLHLTTITLPPSKSCLSAPPLIAPVARPPSLLAPSCSSLSMPVEPAPTTPLRLPSYKLNLNNHGYSRHALLHIKWFWTLREGKRAENDTEQSDLKAYGGTVNLGQPSHCDGYVPFRSSTQRNLAQRFKMKSPVQPNPSPTLPPMSIHPRRGDIASLRDPYCAHIDRCFVNLPSWTLAKTLYMFDVHVGYEWQNRLAATHKWKQSGDSTGIADELEHTCTRATADTVKETTNDALDDVDLDSESESLGTSASVVSSDDSDATLVESENEGDVERQDYAAFEDLMSNAGPSSPLDSGESDHDTPRLKYSWSSSSPTERPSPKCPISPTLYAQMRSPRAEFLSSLADDVETMKPWATNWYRRWEILMELIRFNWGQDQFFAALSANEHQYHTQNQSCSSDDVIGDRTGREGKRRLKRQPRFFFAGSNTIDDDDTSWELDLAFDLSGNGKFSESTFGFGHKLEGSVLL